ncbi:MAG: hypothetical protein ACYSUL_11035 [Planctomycetota bacterium]|jgi:Flp pilus assembly protein CpaB
MNKKRLAIVIIIAGVAVMAGTTMTHALAQTTPRPSQHSQMGKMNMKHAMATETLSLEKIHSEHLPMIFLSIDKATKAVESADKKTALAQLHKAKNMLVTIYGAVGKHVKPQFVNNHCPIMGSPINPAKVTKNLVRDYMGQKVAFCCAGCPSTWDKLPNAQKQAKLAKAKPDLSQMRIEHKH